MSTICPVNSEKGTVAVKSTDTLNPGHEVEPTNEWRSPLADRSPSDTNNPYKSPDLERRTAWQDDRQPTLGQILFSFGGRIPRRTYWAVSLTVAFLAYGGMLLMALLLGESSEVAIGVFFLLMSIPFIWINLAVRVKRWHDRNKSGWWIFINAIPYIGGIWSFIECGCLRGTVGDNHYGPDPT